MADFKPHMVEEGNVRVVKQPSTLLTEGERLFRFSSMQVQVEPQNLNAKQGGCPNRISTTKFTPATWLPLSLFYQFQRVANVYFLVVAIVVLILGEDSPKQWKSKVFPFLGVLLWTALKDAYEDMNRYRDDQEENRGKCKRYNSTTRAFEEVQWQNVLAGDLLYVAADQAFPADLMLLQAAGGNEAFISTVNLDGETNLKEKRAVPLCGKLQLISVNKERSSTIGGGEASLRAEEAAALTAARKLVSEQATLQMSKPEANLAEVRGKMTMNREECPGTEVNFLPRGCVLRNTLWVLGLAAYVGKETKTKLNAVKGQQKVSNMQRHLNRCVQGLLAVLVVVVIFCATMAKILKSDDDDWHVKVLKYLVALYHVVPVSLYVVFEMLKLLLGWQVNNDMQMYDEATGKGAVARTADLMEELGQVDFVFSDKTGTLTANEMIFARCCIEGQDLGDFRKTAGGEGLDKVRGILAATGDRLHEQTKLFFTCLAVCHSVQVEKNPEEGDSKSGKAEKPFIFSGMSPDEVALVEAAATAGIAFQRRVRDAASAGSQLTIVGPHHEDTRNFQVLHELEFNSDRKRMSVVVKVQEEVWCITKGADNVMAGLIEVPFDGGTTESLRRFSKTGLRTLVVAMKKVTPDFLRQWQADLRAAENLVDSSRNDRVAEVQARMETNLRLVGLTAVEDRLQDGVPQAIQTVKDAGVKVWVLTGDKTETAVDIAMSCALFGPSTYLAYAVEAENAQSAVSMLKAAQEALGKTGDGGLVLDGKTVKFALESQEARSLIYELGLASRSCVCCRLSPMQKRLLVELVRQKSPTTITLAIGDGANDVPMLEGAHIGIGVRGKEGAQAVQVSEVAISQFRFLVPLLLCHGRRAYRRVAYFLCYYLYKNVTLVFSDVVWSIQDSFRGRIAYPEYLSMGFNVLFTSWHILFVLGFDKGVPDYVANNHPELYSEGPRRLLFNPKVFGTWMLYAVWHGVIVWIIPNLAYGGLEYTETEPSMFWRASCTSFLVTVVTVNVKLLLICLNPFAIPASASTAVSLLLTVVTLFCLGEVSLGYNMPGNSKMMNVPSAMFGMWQVWACVLGVPLLALLPDVVEKIVRRQFYPNAMDKLLRTLDLSSEKGPDSGKGP